jgi:hypothetical protein
MTKPSCQLAWPPLDLPEELCRPDGADADSHHLVTPLPATDLPDDADHWKSFSAQIEEYAVANTIAEYLDANPEELKLRQGLYLQARITIKRGAVAYAQAKEATELAQRQAEATEMAAKLKQERMRDPYFWLEAAVKRVGAILSKPQVLGVGLALALFWIIKH